MGTFTPILKAVVNWKCAIAFAIGAVTSMSCGFIGMYVATAANYRTAFTAIQSLGGAYQIAFRSGCIIGFCLVSIALLILTSIIIVYIKLFATSN